MNQRLHSVLLATCGCVLSLLASATACRAPAGKLLVTTDRTAAHEKTEVRPTQAPAAPRADRLDSTSMQHAELKPKQTNRIQTIESPASTSAPGVGPKMSSIGGTYTPSPIALPSMQQVAAQDTTASASILPPSVALTSVAIETGQPPAQSMPAVRLSIANVRPGRGPVKVALFTQQASFPNPEGASQTFTFDALHPTVESEVTVEGKFAVAVYQDVNNDGNLNRNRFGIPVEPFAFSNNAMGQRGPPKFDEAAIAAPVPNAFQSPVIIRLP